MILVYSGSSLINARLYSSSDNVWYTYYYAMRNITTDASGTYDYIHGYNRRCFVALRHTFMGQSASVLFDLNYPFPALNYTYSTNLWLVYMCFF
jgi:hypothetical protein